MTDTNDPFQNYQKVDQNTLSLVMSGVMNVTFRVGESENVFQATNVRKPTEAFFMPTYFGK